MKQYKKVLLATATALFMSAPAFAETLRIGTEGAYPPFNLVDSSGEVVGFDLDIANALCAKMEVDCEVVTSDWDGIIPALNNNKFDFLVASMSVTLPILTTPTSCSLLLPSQLISKSMKLA